MEIRLMIAINDYWGNPTFQVDKVDIDDLISVEGKPVPCHPSKWKLELDGLKFNIKGYQRWVGNICWDCVTLEHPHVARILNHLQGKEWQVEEAETTLFEQWRAGEYITPGRLLKLLAHTSH